MDLHLLDPDKVGIQTGAAAGSFVALLVTRKFGWAYAMTLFIIGQITAYYWTIPLMNLFGLNMVYQNPVAFSIGTLGMLIWGAIIALAQSLMNDPKGTLTWLWNLWKGRTQ